MQTDTKTDKFYHDFWDMITNNEESHQKMHFKSPASSNIKLSNDNLKIQYIASSQSSSHSTFNLKTNFPVPKHGLSFYCELLINSIGNTNGEICIGIGSDSLPSHKAPGQTKKAGKSVGLSSKGGIYANKAKKKSIDPFLNGDVIGMCVHLTKSELFFTRNGKRIENSIIDIKSYDEYYIIVSLNSSLQEVITNFGKHPFAFDIKNLNFEEKVKLTNTLSIHNIDHFDMHSIILEYLIHNGYFQAAEKYLQETQLTLKDADLLCGEENNSKNKPALKKGQSQVSRSRCQSEQLILRKVTSFHIESKKRKDSSDNPLLDGLKNQAQEDPKRLRLGSSCLYQTNEEEINWEDTTLYSNTFPKKMTKMNEMTSDDNQLILGYKIKEREAIADLIKGGNIENAIELIQQNFPILLNERQNLHKLLLSAAFILKILADDVDGAGEIVTNKLVQFEDKTVVMSGYSNIQSFSLENLMTLFIGNTLNGEFEPLLNKDNLLNYLIHYTNTEIIEFIGYSKESKIETLLKQFKLCVNHIALTIQSRNKSIGTQKIERKLQFQTTKLYQYIV